MPGPRTSPIWSYFQDDPSDYTRAICTVPACTSKLVSRGKPGTPRGKLSITNLEQHLKRHNAEYSLYLINKKEHEESKETKKRKMEDSPANEMESQSLDSHCRTHESRQNVLVTQQTLDGFLAGGLSTAQPAGSTYPLNDVRDRNKTRNLIKMFAMDLQPISMVSNPGFLNYSFSMDPHYKVKSEIYYKETFDKCLKNGMGKVRDKINADDPESVVMMLDGWTGNHNSHFGMLVSYISSKNFKRVSLAIACSKFNDSHTAENIYQWARNVLEEWGLYRNLSMVVSDSARNMTAMVNLMEGVEHCKCLNHILNLVVCNEILEKPEIKRVIEIMRKISYFPNQSNLFAEAIRSKCQEKGRKVLALCNDVVTRWNSTHDMLQR